ncbi:MAG: SAM-dependent chlorinase/fluorinase [Fervidicoccaceae archaeon]
MARACGLVALLTDYGWSDPYAGILRGVVESLGAGRVRVLDLTHDVGAFDVISGAYVLYSSYRYFPPGTVFLAVVDPGVGSTRRALAVETERYFFVGPDNGLLYPSIVEDRVIELREITNEVLLLRPVSRSFHGRDVFAPVAVHLALGRPIQDVGRIVSPRDIVELRLKDPCPKDLPAVARAIYVDRFGNVALSLGAECVERICERRERLTISAGERVVVARCLPVFSLAERGEAVLYENSLGFAEVAVNLGNAAEVLGVRVGDLISIEPAP